MLSKNMCPLDSTSSGKKKKKSDEKNARPPEKKRAQRCLEELSVPARLDLKAGWLVGRQTDRQDSQAASGLCCREAQVLIPAEMGFSDPAAS